MGITGISLPEIFGFQLEGSNIYLVLVITCVFLCFLVVRLLINSPWGRVLMAIREDDMYVQSVGKNTLSTRVVSFMLAGGMAGLAGALYAPYLTFIDPTSFTITESIFILSIVIIGGAGSLWGPIVGAAVLVTLPELLRFAGFPETVSANLRQILYGVFLVLILIYRPQGIVGQYVFGHK